MKLDPNIACANQRENWFWAAVHDALAHPLMPITGYSQVAMRFHDWTSRKAWPREADRGVLEVWFASPYGELRVRNPRPGYWTVDHGQVHHQFGTMADNADQAVGEALCHFRDLDKHFGGRFAARAAGDTK
jgi:hypothetical protein